MAAVIGPASSSSVKATYPVISRSHIPQISPFATDPSLSVREGELFPYLLKVTLIGSVEINCMSSFYRLNIFIQLQKR